MLLKFKKIAWIRSHHLHLQWKFKLLAEKSTWGNEAKHFCQQTSNVLPLHLKQTFPPIIWIYTEGEGIESRLTLTLFLLYPSKYEYFILVCRYFVNHKNFTKLCDRISKRNRKATFRGLKWEQIWCEKIHNRFVQEESSRIPRRKSYLQTWHMTLNSIVTIKPNTFWNRNYILVVIY